jgi:hypothetical protein
MHPPGQIVLLPKSSPSFVFADGGTKVLSVGSCTLQDPLSYCVYISLLGTPLNMSFVGVQV